MRVWTFVVVSLTLVCGGGSQDVALDVLLLARIKSHVREELPNLPNYTCLETIARFHREPARAAHGHEQLVNSSGGQEP
jgi:hypothetical protein